MSSPTLTLAMIVRDGGESLARCLKSARPAVQQILIGDTGSTDDSIVIARRFGAKVIEFPWENDFAKARNTVLEAVQTDWVLWLDADEMLDPSGAAQIPVLIDQKEIDAFEVWRWNYVRTLNSRSGGLMAEPNTFRLEESRPYPAYTRYLNTLLFRRRPGLHFEFAVHETVANRVRALGLRAAEAPFVIHHFGFVEGAEGMRREKNERYHQLGVKKVLENPNDAWALYELGLSELEHRRDPAAALVCLERSLLLNQGNRIAWIYAGICLTRLGRLSEALDFLQHVEETGFRSNLLAEAMGDVYFHRGSDHEAVRWYEQAGMGPLVSALVDCKRGACQVRLGEAAAGLERIQAAVSREPQAGELYEIWAAAALQAGDAATAARVASTRLGVGQPPAGSYVVSAILEAHLGDWEKALTTLSEGQRHYPEDPELKREVQTARERLSAAQPVG